MWIATGCIALGASGTLAFAYFLSWRRLRHEAAFPPDSPARIPAASNLRRELMRVLAQSVFLVAGILAAYQYVYGPQENSRLAIIVCLLGGQCVLAADSWADWHDDRRLVAAVERWSKRYVAVPKDEVP